MRVNIAVFHWSWRRTKLSNYNSLQQTTRCSDLRKESSNGCSLPIISSTGAISEQSSESSTASCITALTNQLDLANDEISDLKAKLIYYKGKTIKNMLIVVMMMMMIMIVIIFLQKNHKTY